MAVRPAWLCVAAGLLVLLVLFGLPLLGLIPAAILLAAIMAGLALAVGRLAAPRPASPAAVPALLEEVTAASPNGRLVVGPGGDVLYANQAYRDIVGAKGAATPSLAGVFAGDAEACDRLLRLERVALNGSDARDEFSFLESEGRRRWLSVSVHPLPNAAGHVVWYVADGTPAHEIAEAIRDEQDKLADFIDNAPVGFYSVDEAGRFLFVNRTLAEWLGYTPEEIIHGAQGGLHLSQVLDLPQGVQGHPLDGAAPLPIRAETPDTEVKLIARDGSRRTVRITQSVVADLASGELRTRSVVRDLTPELVWRNALRQAEAHFRRFFDFAPIGIVVLDSAGMVVEANAAFVRLTGSGAGGRLLDLVRAEDRDELVARLAEAHHSEAGMPPLEVRFPAGGGSERPGRVTQLFAGRLDQSTAEEGTLLLHLIDTTEQKSLEVQFAQSQKMQAVGQLAGGIAHDFNNLLTAMIGFCDLLLLRHQPGDQSFADIMQIKQNANRAANLVRQLLAFSRQQTLRPKVLDITDVLADLRNLLSRLIGETIELKMVHGRDLGLVKVDQGQFEQVIINLAVNARDAMTSGGSLIIRTSNVTVTEAVQLGGGDRMTPGDYVCVDVVDAGHGIPPENMTKIFEPFFTTKAVGAGTGLGLSTVYGIIKQTGGFVVPESKVGVGTTFRIYLPRHRPTEADAVVGTEAQTTGSRDLTGKGTVLLVEDEDAVRIFAARALRNKGYSVLEASSGEGALKLVETHPDPIDLLVTDVVMANIDGPTLARRIREQKPEMKIIFISGYAEDAFRKHNDRLEDVSFLPKPFSLAQLATMVKDVLKPRG